MENYAGFECRFCLKKIGNGECIAFIDDEIRENYSNITQIKLTDGFSEAICEICLRSIQFSSSFKNQLLKNHRTLLDEKIKNIQNYKRLLPECTISLQNYKVIQKPNENNSTPKKDDSNLKIIKIQSGMNTSNPVETESNQAAPSGVRLSQVHHNRVAPYNSPTFSCLHCTKTFTRNDALNRHINNIHLNLLYRCVVEGCDSSFSMKERLRSHFFSKHTHLSGDEMKEKLQQIAYLKPQ